MNIKKAFFLCFWAFLLAGIYVAWELRQDPTLELPPLQDGDLVLQTTYTSQSLAIMWATKSLYDHVGIVSREPTGVYVIEAGPAIMKTPFPEWVRRGMFKRMTIFRDPRLNDEERTQLVKAAEQYLGRKYDYYFLFDTETLYCSEVPYHAYQAIDRRIGQAQDVRSLDVNNFLVEKLIKERWAKHPLCQEKGMDYETCRERIFSQRLITPASIAEDHRLEMIYDNYPF